MPLSKKQLIVLAFLAVYVIWGSTYIAIKFVIEDVPPFLSSGIRFIFAGGLLLALALVNNKNLVRPTARQWIDCSILAFCLLVMGSSGVVLAEKTVPTGIVSLLVTSVPIYILLLEWLTTRVRPPVTSFIGLVFGVLGMVILVDPQIVNDGPGLDLIGVSYVLIGAFGSAIGAVYSRKAALPDSQRMSAGLQMLIAGLILMVLSAIFAEKPEALKTIGPPAIYAMIYLAIFGSVVAFSAYTYLLKHVQASRVATYAYVNPVVAVFLGWLIAHEPLSERTLLGAIVLIFAVWLINKGKSSKVIPTATTCDVTVQEHVCKK
jgi:Permeases of the drug/metabolite transporter (DMT) superfamily